jgi:hypothetical protein
VSTEEQQPRPSGVRCEDVHDDWLCTMFRGHSGDHEARGARKGKVYATWPQEPPPPPQVWELPAEPGPEVTRLRDKDGDEWKRHVPPPWAKSASQSEWHSEKRRLVVTWLGLLAYGPLVDCTPTDKP